MKMGFRGKNISIFVSALLLTSNVLFADTQKEEDTKKLDSVTVVDSTVSNYQNTEAPKITRGHITLENTAKSIQVFNEDFIDDFQPESIEDIVTLSSNVVSFGTNNGRSNIFAIRGFMNLPVLRDGLNIPNAIANPDVYGLEKIEVLKGPDSLEYGEGGAGGLINLVKKKPDQKEFFGEIAFTGTSEHKYNPKFDVGGSLNSDGSARFRLVSSYTRQDDYKNFDTDIEKIYVAPSIAYDINDNNTITFVTEYYKANIPTDYGMAIKSNGKPAGSYDDIISHPDDDMETTQKTIGFDLDSTFSNFNSNFRYRYIDYKMDIGDTQLPTAYNETTNTLSGMYANMYYHNKEHILQYTIDKEFKIKEIKHNLSLGLDYTNLNQEADGNFSRASIYSINVSSQNFSSSMLSKPSTVSDFVDAIDIEKYGGFLQDNIELNDKLVLNLGLRHDLVEIDPEKSSSYKKNATSPTVGLVYKYSDNGSLFYNYAKSFKLQDTRYTDVNGKLLDPEEGKGFEFGVKHNFFNERLSLTASVFNINKENVPVYDDTTLKYSAGYTQKSNGFEFDIAGKITDNWSFLASYGYTNTKTNYDVAQRGAPALRYTNRKIVGVPTQSASIFTTYYLTPNVYIGGGARYIGERYADYANEIKVNGDIIFNASVGYREKNWSFDLAVKNLTDEEYFEAVGSNGLGSVHRNNELGNPRTFIATLKYKF